MHFWQERPRGHGASSAGQPGQGSHSPGTSRSPQEPRLPGGISVSVRRGARPSAETERREGGGGGVSRGEVPAVSGESGGTSRGGAELTRAHSVLQAFFVFCPHFANSLGPMPPSAWVWNTVPPTAKCWGPQDHPWVQRFTGGTHGLSKAAVLRLGSPRRKDSQNQQKYEAYGAESRPGQASSHSGLPFPPQKPGVTHAGHPANQGRSPEPRQAGFVLGVRPWDWP